MKRLLFILLFALPLFSQSQTDTGRYSTSLGKVVVGHWTSDGVLVITEEKGQKGYVSVSVGGNSYREGGVSIEAGKWGVHVPFSWGVVYDLNYGSDFKTPSSWIGLKAYFTFYETERWCYMFSLAPKIAMSKGDNNTLVEGGLSFNYSLKDNFLLSTGVTLQSAQTYNLVPGLYGGVVILFNNKGD
jgi:hypothetical protein